VAVDFLDGYLHPLVFHSLSLHFISDDMRSNPALNLAPFGRWTALKRRRLALR